MLFRSGIDEVTVSSTNTIAEINDGEITTYTLAPQAFGFIPCKKSDLVPDRSLSVYEGAIVCWRGEKMGEWKEELIHKAEKFDFPSFTPYYELTDVQRRLLWEGNQMCIRDSIKSVISLKAETHNFPTTVEPFNGASDFGNKFGQPLICGSVLTFEHSKPE